MHLYSGPSTQFLDDATRNVIGDKIAQSFIEHFGFNAAPSEIAS